MAAVAVVEAVAGGNHDSRTMKRFLKKSITYLAVFLLLSFICSVLIVVVFKWAPVPFSSIMAQRQIEAIFTDEPYVEYQWYSWDEITPYMAMAVIAAEDQNFAIHSGFDIEAIQEAMDEARDGGRSRGASTISQQVSKNLFLWGGRSWIRKGLEAYFTVLIELFWSKKRIIEVYVNIAEMGPNVFGVGAASIKYYNKTPDAISRQQAALLAATLPNPRTHRVQNPSRYMRSRQTWILRQINGLGGTSYLDSL